MAMTYQEFKDWLITFLWKAGDTQVINNLDNLIRMGSQDLIRRLRVEAQHKTVTLIADSLRIELPNDYQTIRSITNVDDNLGTFKYVSPADLFQLRAKYANNSWLPFYSLEDKHLLLTGPAVDMRRTSGPNPPANPLEGDLWYRTTVSPGLYIWQVDANSSQWVQVTGEYAISTNPSYTNITLLLSYKRGVPDYAGTDVSWMEEEYFDLLTYSVLRNSAPFLREDERIQTWEGFYKDHLEAANEESAHGKEHGVYASKPLPRQASVNRRSRGPGIAR